ncbi:MAG: DUF3775 domain-containing protein [Hyphomicrobiaceae bacterium]
MLEISPEKVAHVIVKAREFDVKVDAWDGGASGGEVNDDPEAVLEDLPDDPVMGELIGFIDRLNVDEQVSLVALMWIGRGTYDALEIEEAKATARSERVNATSAYLLGVPLLADYLEEGLEKLGISIEDAEKGIL